MLPAIRTRRHQQVRLVSNWHVEEAWNRHEPAHRIERGCAVREAEVQADEPAGMERGRWITATRGDDRAAVHLRADIGDRYGIRARANPMPHVGNYPAAGECSLECPCVSKGRAAKRHLRAPLVENTHLVMTHIRAKDVRARNVRETHCRNDVRTEQEWVGVGNGASPTSRRLIACHRGQTRRPEEIAILDADRNRRGRHNARNRAQGPRITRRNGQIDGIAARATGHAEDDVGVDALVTQATKRFGDTGRIHTIAGLEQ